MHEAIFHFSAWFEDRAAHLLTGWSSDCAAASGLRVAWDYRLRFVGIAPFKSRPKGGSNAVVDREHKSSA
jgi:hypothetical protein